MKTTKKYILNGRFFDTLEDAKIYAAVSLNCWVERTEEYRGKILCHVVGVDVKQKSNAA
jgi:hypothetical protein